MNKAVLALIAMCGAGGAAAAPGELQLPAFPLPALVLEDGPPKEISSLRLLRELHRGGVSGFHNFETVDSGYALLRSDGLDHLAAWLEQVCRSIGYDLAQAREHRYDGVVFARLLNVGTSLASMREKQIALAMPIGVLVCRRAEAWGGLPADGAEDAYVLFVTDAGMMVYDPPTRQLATLADFPNKASILRIRF